MEGYYLSPKSDFVFKKIFGDPNNVDILADFLKATLDIPAEEYERIDISDTHLNKREFEDKTGILNLKITTKSGTIIDVEIQKASLADMDKRVIFYLSRLITDQLGDGDPYEKIKRSIIILIADYDFIKDSNKYHNVWRLRDKTGKDFSDLVEINTIELTKVPKEKDGNLLWSWLKFFNSKSQEEFKDISTESQKIAKAVNVLGIISQDKDARTIYRADQKKQMDDQAKIKWALEEGVRQGLKQGKIDGKLEGLKEGEIKGKLEGLKEGKLEGLKEGEIKGKIKTKIEDVRKVIENYNVDIEKAMKDFDLDMRYKDQVLNRLSDMDSN